MTSTRLVHGVGANALEWLYAHREGFRLEVDADPEVGFLERFKPVGELAMICAVLFREGVAGSRQADLARRLLDHAWLQTLDGGRMLVRGHRTEPASPIPFEVYLPFRELGRSVPEMDYALGVCARLRAWQAREVAPVRRLGLSAFAARFGLPPDPPVAQAAAQTWLGRTPEPWTVDGHTAYDVTHTVFHLTGWGEHPQDLPADVAAYLTAWLPAWLDDWLDLRRWDLLGELLCVDACLPQPTLDPAAWRGFAAAQQDDGAMPAVREMPHGDPSDVFDVVYHSTLVAAFASVLATSRSLSRLAGAAP
ncbi:DUF6895 family protein [Actinacidiphila acidipaludis]|uniref:DUF6895 domain-containing protein n=1 Tax=Actinacidiphila acidipaludis TaxID=2873382 RepID=A0ABS7QGV8_9ACTN|nr:hypothetical protein [Streptomyces acidipaludis]MBY8882397.1 hypothetical protein [Streptomyces acidipaludis]